MREILFRGKTTRSKIWVYGDYSTNYGTGHTEIREKAECCYVEVLPETVGQYTGLTDKNGKKIFEGDIIKIDNKYIRYIEYSDECSAFVKFRYIDKLTSEFSGYLGKGYDNYKQTIEIIGNIHDNPEFLPKGE